MAGSTFIGEAGDMLLGGIRAVVTMKGRKLGLSPHGQHWQQGGPGAAAPPTRHPPSTTVVCVYRHAGTHAGLLADWLAALRHC